jgi:uncharacterized protein (DUF58 family)
MSDRFSKFAKNRKVYIVPTKFGMALFFSVLFMLMAGAAYANNLVNLLGFFLAAIGFVTMIQTHNNVRGVTVLSAKMEPGYAGHPLRLNVVAEAADNLDHHHLEADVLGYEAQPRLEFSSTLFARSKQRLATSYIVPKRGVYNFKRVKISSVYPLGLFYAWSLHAVDEEFFVYPSPAGTHELPIPKGSYFAESSAKLQFSGDDYREHRFYQPTDSARHVDWKAYARGRPLLTKRFDEGGPEAVILNWSQTQQTKVEEKLSQLSLWIELAHRSERSFSLQLPRTKIDFGHDHLHAHRCWKELAKYDAQNKEELA